MNLSEIRVSFEVGQVGAAVGKECRCKHKHVDGIRPKPRPEVIVAVLQEESAKEVIIESPVVVADKVEFVGLVILVYILCKHGDKLRVNLTHRGISHDLFTGHAADGKGGIFDLCLWVGLNLEIECFNALAVNHDFTADLVNAVATGVCSGRFKVVKE